MLEVERVVGNFVFLLEKFDEVGIFMEELLLFGALRAGVLGLLFRCLHYI